MEYVHLSKLRGFKYACNSHLYSQYSKKKGVIYLKCDTGDCKGTAKIDKELLYTINDHDRHQTMEREIVELSVLERMRKRASHDNSTSRCNIYLEEMRQCTELSSVGYAAVESSLYKQRRLRQPSLPSSIDAVCSQPHDRQPTDRTTGGHKQQWRRWNWNERCGWSTGGNDSTIVIVDVSDIWWGRAASSDCRACSLRSMSAWAQGTTGTGSMWTLLL